MMAKRKAAVEQAENTVVIDNVGPIDHVEIPLMPGRVTLLSGSNGAGKTESLLAINALAGRGTEGLSVRDGAEEGRISGFGAAVKLTARTNRRTGELDILVVEDGFSLARFVRPGSTAADPKARAKANDKKRLQDLASVLGVKIEPSDVWALVGGRGEDRAAVLADESLSGAEKTARLEQIMSAERKVYRSIVSEGTAKANDPAEFVTLLKRDLDAVALEREKLAAVVEAEAETLRGTLPAGEIEAVTDSEVLSAKLAAAVNHKADLQRRDETAAEMVRLAAAAREVLESGQGLSVADAQTKLDEATADVTESAAMIAEAERMLAVERERFRGLQNVAQAAALAVGEAKSRADRLEAARKNLEATATKPTDQEWTAAEQEIAAAEAAILRAGDQRKAAATLVEIEAKEDESGELLIEAERFRNAAKSVAGLLVDPINKIGCGIEIDSDMRLVCVDHPRGRCYVEDLSPGEGWTLAIQLIVGLNRDETIPAIVAIPQEAFEGLDGHNRQLLLDAVAQTQLMIVTAKASEETDRQAVSAELLD